MVLLLDTNALLWALSDKAKLGSKAERDITNPANQVFASDICLLECAIKQRTGKLEIKLDFATLDAELLAAGIRQIAFDAWSGKQFVEQANLGWSDPFDAAHMALAMAKGMVLATSDDNILGCKLPGLKVMDTRI